MTDLQCNHIFAIESHSFVWFDWSLFLLWVDLDHIFCFLNSTEDAVGGFVCEEISMEWGFINQS